ncbi:MAG: hypothetical protein ACI35Q_03630 [Marinilabiliaceae bacterium]
MPSTDTPKNIRDIFYTPLLKVATAALAILLSGNAVAQPFGVFPAGGCDAQAAQIKGDAEKVETRIWEVDFTQRTIKKAQLISHTVDYYTANGMISTHIAYDTGDEMDSKTIYQYSDDGNKRVSTTYSKTGERTLQTLYAYTADGYLARMRFTDADAVTISTTEVGITAESATTEEVYNDSERVRATYYYDKKHNLTRIVKDDGHTTSDQKFVLTYDGLPARGSYVTPFEKNAMTFEHETDEYGNWTRRVTYIDGVATEVAERNITYAD